MDVLITFFLVVKGFLSRQSLTLPPGLLNPLPHSETYFGIYHSITHPSFYL